MNDSRSAPATAGRHAFVALVATLAIQVFTSLAATATAVLAPEIAQAFAIAPKWIGVFVGLVYAGAAVTNIFYYFMQTFLGPHPPPNTLYYLAFNLPWLIAPALLGARVFFGRDLRARGG